MSSASSTCVLWVDFWCQDAASQSEESCDEAVRRPICISMFTESCSSNRRCCDKCARERFHAGGPELALPVYAEAGHWQLVHSVAAELGADIRDDYLIR